MSSRSTQIAKQNCSAEEPERAAKQCYTRFAFEHTIWRSEVRRKVVAGDAPFGRTIGHVSSQPIAEYVFKKVF